MNHEISTRIRSIRESRGFSQGFIAGKLGITQQAYSAIEKKPANTTLAKLKSIAQVLDVELITLIQDPNSFIQYNSNQQGGNVASQMVFNQNNQETIHLYERTISQLKDEIVFLRKMLFRNTPAITKLLNELDNETEP